MVDATDAVHAAEVVQPFHHGQRREWLAIERHGPALFERDLDVRGRRWRVFGGARPFVSARWRFLPRVFEHARLAAPAPDVFIDRERPLLAPRNVDAVRLQVFDLVFARHRLLAGRGHDLERRVKCLDAHIEAHLIVALACAAVGHGSRAFFMGDIDEQLREQRPGKRGRERVGVLVDCARRQRREGEVFEEVLAAVDHAHLERASGHGARFDHWLFAALADIDIERDDIVAAFDREPFNRGRGIEATGVGEDELRHGGVVPRDE